MNYQYQLFIGLTNKVFTHYYNNLKYFIKDILPKSNSDLEKKIKEGKYGKGSNIRK
jgi:hypothetical protein